jgi:predicted transposase YbfD/YdcC
MEDLSAFSARPRLAALLDHFAKVEDTRQAWKVMYPLREVLFLVVCGTIASGDDYDDIVDWGKAHLAFLRGFAEFHFGIPCADWLRCVMNRIDPKLFAACFMAWTRELRPDVPDVVAFDGKTSRRTHDRSAGKAALHLVSAFATAERLVLGQQAVADKSCEQEAIPELVDKLAASGTLAGAVVTIDAIACNPKIAANLIAAGADYVLTVKDNQPSLKAEVERFFADAPLASLDVHCDIDKGHGRIEERRCVVSSDIGWLQGDRRFPREYRFPKLTAIAMIEATVELKDRCHRERRYYIASRPFSAERFAYVVRSHWRIENSLHWVLDVIFREDLSRLRKGHGAANMAVVRHFALNLVRTVQDKRSLKVRRKLAGWDVNYLASILKPTAH